MEKMSSDNQEKWEYSTEQAGKDGRLAKTLRLEAACGCGRCSQSNSPLHGTGENDGLPFGVEFQVSHI